MNTTKRGMVDGKEEVCVHPQVAQHFLSIHKKMNKIIEEFDELFKLIQKEDSELEVE